jgi:hypothetical protein
MKYLHYCDCTTNVKSRSVHVNDSTVRVIPMMSARQMLHYALLIISAVTLLYVLCSYSWCAVSTHMLPQTNAPIEEHFRFVQALMLLFLKEGRWKVCL